MIAIYALALAAARPSYKGIDAADLDFARFAAAQLRFPSANILACRRIDWLSCNEVANPGPTELNCRIHERGRPRHERKTLTVQMNGDDWELIHGSSCSPLKN